VYALCFFLVYNNFICT